MNLLVLGVALLAAAFPLGSSTTAADNPLRAPIVGAPNPAAVYCIEQGGRHDVRKGPDGEVGICVFPDGREVNAWDYFRARVAPST